MGIRSSVDLGSLSSALARPGMDTRLWVTLAVVTDVAFDAAHGMFAEVRLLSTGDNETVVVGSEYAGDGWGTYYPPKVDDVVLVAVPDGDPGQGAVLIKRLWSASHKPPGELKNASSNEPTDATGDPTIVVEPGRKLRVVARDGANVNFEISGSGTFNVTATGDAQVNIKAEKAVVVDSPNVMLGDTPGSQVARVGDLVIGPALGVIVPPAPTAIPVLPVPAVPPYVAVVGQIVSGAPSVKA